MALPMLPMLLLAGGALMVLKNRGGGSPGVSGLDLSKGDLSNNPALSNNPITGVVSGQNGNWKWRIGLEPARVGFANSEPRWWSRIGPMRAKSGGGSVWDPEPKEYGPVSETMARGAGFLRANIMANSRPPVIHRVPPPPPPAPSLPPAPAMGTSIDNLYGGALASQGNALAPEPYPGRWMGWGTSIKEEYSKMHRIWSTPPNSKSNSAFIGIDGMPEAVLAWQSFAPTSERFFDSPKIWARKRNARLPHPELLEFIGSGSSGTKPLEVFTALITMANRTGEAVASGIQAVGSLMAGNVPGPQVQFGIDVKNAAESIIQPSKAWHNEAMQRKSGAVPLIQEAVFYYLWELALWNPWLLNNGKIDLSFRYKCSPATLGDLFAGGTCPPWIFIPPGNYKAHGITPLGLQLG